MNVLAAVTSEIKADQWFYVGWPIVAYGLVVLVLFLLGHHEGETNPVRIFFRRISVSLEQGTGMPGWAAAGVLSGLVFLGMAALGLYWDVAWHYDLGRDRELMTPSHTMIVLGLAGLVYAAVISVIFATLDRADVGFRAIGLTIPWSALSLGALGAGGLAAFPFDALWHEAYGVDVTLWSPSHLQLVGGGGLATIAVWLMIAEARPWSRPTWLGHVTHVTVAGAVLTGLSAFQAEFDFGLPQFQVLYLPLLTTAAAGFALVAARVALGRGGALQAVVAFLVIRGVIALLVAGSLNHTVPRFPLYLVAALAVEVLAWVVGTDRPLRFAVAAGAAVATFGVAGEWLWDDVSGRFELSPWLLPKLVVLAPLVGISAAVLGAGLSRAFSGRDVGRGALALAGLGVVAAFVYPVSRSVGDVDAVVRLVPAGAEEATVEVELTPADAAERATEFGVVAWQGGGLVRAELDEVGPGRYVSSRPMPVTGPWKTLIGLYRGSQVMAVPVYLPADPDIGAAEVPALPERRAAFVRNTDLLLREVNAGPAWPAVLAYSGLAVITAGWVWLFVLAITRPKRPFGTVSEPGPPPSRPEETRVVQPT